MSKDYGKVASDKAIETAKKALEEHGFKVHVVENLEEARQEVLKQIPKGAQVLTNTSVTLEEAGLTKELNESGKYVSVRQKFQPLLFGSKDPAKRLEARRIGSGAEYAIGSVHAVTQDGQVVIASQTGSQLPGYAYGADHVMWLVGAQKIVKDLPEALDRIETHSLPLEDKRARAAYGTSSSINKLLIYRKEPRDRVTIILIKQAVGY